MIIESIVTTVAPDGTPNIAPMGVEWGDEVIVLKPFVQTTTYRNLVASGTAVVNLIDDVLLFARGATGTATAPTIPAEHVAGVVLADACSWREVEIVRADHEPPRARLETRVVHRGIHREFLGFNRARHAVLEGAILATRTHLLPAVEIVEAFTRLRVPIEKTAGPVEWEAWRLLEAFIRGRGIPLPTHEGPAIRTPT